MNALVIKASSLYILKQMPHVSICFRFSSLCLWKEKTKFWTIESIVSPHNSVGPVSYFDTHKRNAEVGRHSGAPDGKEIA